MFFELFKEKMQIHFIKNFINISGHNLKISFNRWVFFSIFVMSIAFVICVAIIFI